MKPTIDALKIFHNIRRVCPRAFFFQSRGGDGPTRDLTVIGLEAVDIFSVRNGVGTFEKAGLRSAQPFEALKQRLDEYKCSEDAHPYSNGGAFGVIGYDLVREIEPRLKRFGLFQLSSSQSEAEIHFVRNLIVVNNATNEIRLVLKSESGPAFKHRKELEAIIASFTYEVAPTATADLAHRRKVVKQRLQATLGKALFVEKVRAAQENIAAGEIFQTVLAERFELETVVPSIDIFTSLRKVSRSAYSYFFSLEGREFFGASPELLVKSKRGQLETHPIAGTRARGLTDEADHALENELVNCPKEAAEHLMLVDLARNDIGKVSTPGSVDVKVFREVMRLPNVMHLISKVQGQLREELTELDAFKACFPAGTLSGAPKVRAMELISELETVPRGLYGGAVVAFDFQGGFDSCIAIRSLESSAGKVILRAGAGIVADSNPESEYQEIEDKLAGLLTAIAHAELRHDSVN